MLLQKRCIAILLTTASLAVALVTPRELSLHQTLHVVNGVPEQLGYQSASQYYDPGVQHRRRLQAKQQATRPAQDQIETSRPMGIQTQSQRGFSSSVFANPPHSAVNSMMSSVGGMQGLTRIGGGGVQGLIGGGGGGGGQGPGFVNVHGLMGNVQGIVGNGPSENGMSADFMGGRSTHVHRLVGGGDMLGSGLMSGDMLGSGLMSGDMLGYGLMSGDMLGSGLMSRDMFGSGLMNGGSGLMGGSGLTQGFVGDRSRFPLSGVVTSVGSVARERDRLSRG